jgi:hypothetical protein
MDSDRTKKCDVIVNGQGAGTIGKLKHISLRIKSLWAYGSDGEKFEVLAAIRRRFRPGVKVDIRISEYQTPAEVGRRDGFSELEYQHISPWSARITIVPVLMRYLRLIPRAQMANGYTPPIADESDNKVAGAERS